MIGIIVSIVFIAIFLIGFFVLKFGFDGDYSPYSIISMFCLAASTMFLLVEIDYYKVNKYIDEHPTCTCYLDGQEVDKNNIDVFLYTLRIDEDQNKIFLTRRR